ncbi:hypothetical protein [Variovorax sp. YR266]|uniref:hypothetical protein n=1 Tax=Variovorax sp. YR266 TaxID=1884386 RepID=UPI000B88A06B|nr:hypothetical protein [Variovorax sp. YR266]
MGEGYAHLALLKHIRNIYAGADADCGMTLANARGQGARHVITHAVRAARNGSYDRVAAFLNPASDWNESVQKLARAKKISVLFSRPCLEAPLLHIHGDAPQRTADECRREFKARFGSDVHDADVLQQFFQRSILDDACSRVALLQELLALVNAR